MKKSYIMLSIALIVSGSIEAKKPTNAQPRTATPQEKKNIMNAIGSQYDVNTSFSKDVQNIIKTVDINFQDSGYYYNTPLNAAARIAANKKLSFLLANGAAPSLTIQNSEGSTPLGNAAENGNYKAVKLILQWSKANGTKGQNDPATLLNIKDHYTGGSMTPLQRAQYAMDNGWDNNRRKKADYQKTINVLQSYSK